MCDSKPIRPRALLRADAGRSIGFGHYVRTCAMAAYMADDYDCTIFSRNPEGGDLSPFQRSLLGKAGFMAYPDRDAGDLGKYNLWFLDQIRADDLVVLDNYFHTTEYMNQVKRRCRALVCIDDMHDRHFPADAVLTFCPLEERDFDLAPYTRFRGGIEWSFLRLPFLKPLTTTPRDSERIVMAMGGADPLGLTEKMLGILSEIAPSKQIDVIAGDTVKVSPRPGVRIHRGADASEIAGIFDQSSLGIFPASTICVEALSRRLPIAAGYFVDNQEEIYADGVKRGWFMPLGSFRDSSAEIAQRIEPALRNIREGAHTAPQIDFQKTRTELLTLLGECMKNS
ncbi:MAG: hypothetical protein K2M87_02205 [Muribaculaceae bacterium]|nr:hypothetical protein [Muribaculaceae bacterium]